MKQISQYLCETCGTKFDTAEEATKCENSHLSITSVVGKYHKGRDIPYVISVTLENGGVINYCEE